MPATASKSHPHFWWPEMRPSRARLQNFGFQNFEFQFFFIILFNKIPAATDPPPNYLKKIMVTNLHKGERPHVGDICGT